MTRSSVPLMTKSRFLTERFRQSLFLRLPLFLSLIIGLAICAKAQDSEQSLAATQEETTSGLIEAVVIDVEGTNLKIAGGLVIDVSKATIMSIGEGRINISFKPGMCIRAHIIGSNNAASTLVADFVRVQPEDRIVFSGILQEADLDRGFITFMNRRILITSETSIPVGFKQRKIKAGLPVSVIVKSSGADLVATVIFPNIVLPNIFP
jgi:hypothetical protein